MKQHSGKSDRIHSRNAAERKDDSGLPSTQLKDNRKTNSYPDTRTKTLSLNTISPEYVNSPFDSSSVKASSPEHSASIGSILQLKEFGEDYGRIWTRSKSWDKRLMDIWYDTLEYHSISGYDVPTTKRRVRLTAEVAQRCDQYLNADDSSKDFTYPVEQLKMEAQTMGTILKRALDVFIGLDDGLPCDPQEARTLVRFIFGSADDCPVDQDLMTLLHNALKESASLEINNGYSEDDPIRTSLQNGSKKVALVGESHNKIDRTEEKAQWFEEGISVVYEDGKYYDPEANKEEFLDNQQLKLMHLWLELKNLWTEERAEKISAKKSKWFNYILIPQKVKEELTFIKDICNGISLSAINIFQELANTENGDLAHEVASATFPLVDLMQAIVANFSKLNPAQITEHFLALNVKIEQLAEVLGHDTTKKPKDFSIARSGYLVNKVNQIAASNSKLIVKLGEFHLKDITSQDLDVNDIVLVRSQVQYEGEYQNVVNSKKPLLDFL